MARRQSTAKAVTGSVEGSVEFEGGIAMLPEAAEAAEVPSFTLRADQPGHLEGSVEFEGGIATVSEAAEAAEVPSFTLRADQPGHLEALVLVTNCLERDALMAATRKIREFELWAEANK